MSYDSFGNLREWSRVPEQIEAAVATGKLDEHQAGLARVLRYRDNWRLRELALRSMKHLTAPSDELVSEVLGVIADEDVYCEVRILAAQALVDLLVRKDVGPAASRGVLCRVAETMRTLLDSAGTPVLHDALRASLAAIEGARQARGAEERQ